LTACPRVVSSTRRASQSPRRRGSLRPTPASACRAARTASISSLFTPPRRAGVAAGRPQRPARSKPAAPCQSDTETAGAFDGPQTRAMAPAEADQPAVTGRIRGNCQVLQHSARRADRRRSMGVVMGVNADDNVKIWMESQLAVRSLWVRGQRIPARTTLRQDCDEPHPKADKLLIRPTRQPGPAPATRTDKSH
jgi:hypothetical protein